jgi:hypothetical protein
VEDLGDAGLTLVLAARDPSLLPPPGNHVLVLPGPSVREDGTLDLNALENQFSALAGKKGWTAETAAVRVTASGNVRPGFIEADVDRLSLPLLREALKAFLLTPVEPIDMERLLHAVAAIARYA